ncbi:MAG TPA: CoA-transferase subunit beta [Methylomirabilota bacterium]|jgi:glutaconate CoA-transferase subunit B|nr:CoA-transferase subunit beta [Methylomirabilota bacterium]
MTAGWTAEEMMTIAAARLLKNGTVCFVGIGLPSAAANLARLTHAPEIVLIYESGCIGTKPTVLPLSIGDGELAETADTVVSVPEIFRYWLQGGRIDVGFLGAAQLDRFGTINTTVIGEYGRPSVRLPGAGGAPEIATLAGEVFIILRHGKRALVERLDFATSRGFLPGDRVEGAGKRGKGPSVLVTDLGILKPDPDTRELTLASLHPGITVEQAKAATGWALKLAPDLKETPPPTAAELGALRALQDRTRRAHGED